MTKLTVTLYAAAMLFPRAAMGAPTAEVCGTGTLIDVQVDTQITQAGTTEQGSVRNKKNGKKEYQSYSNTYTQQKTTYTVTVQLDDILYTAQSEGFFGFGFKPTAFIVNDPVQGCVRGGTLALARPDGKEYRAHLVRAVRVSHQQ